jgi:hypothetical protein
MSSIAHFRRMPRSAQASTLLTTTFATVCATLGIWLILWLLLVRPKTDLVAVLPDESPVAIHWLSGLLPPRVDPESATWQKERLDSIDAVHSILDKHSGRPIILYLNAPIASTASKADPGKGAISSDAIKELVRICQQEHGTTKLLLIIDPGRVGPDPVLGLKDNPDRDWLDLLQREGRLPPADPQKRREWDEKWRNFGIFCACSPDQLSWPVEGQGRTIFDKILNQSLAKPRKLRKTIDLVSFWVAHLVQEFIPGAAQNPMYLGDPDLDFFIRAEKPRPALVVEGQQGREEEKEKALSQRLNEEFKHRDEYEKRKPYRYAAAAWRDYQDHLLRAERLFRAHRPDDADAELNSAQTTARALADHKTSFGSLALGIRYAANPSDYERLEGDLKTALKQNQSPTAAAARVVPKKEAESPGDKKPDAPAASAKPAPAGPQVPNDDLFLRINSPLAYVRDHWKDYVEGQLIEWMVAYQHLPPLEKKETLFTDQRKELFVRAIDLRRRAECAAAAAIDPKTALRRAIEKGDEHLRSAQDHLFIDQGRTQDRAEKELVKAEEQYRWAEICVEAQDLVGRVQSELPFLGVWSVRHSARLHNPDSPKPGEEIKQIAELAQALDNKLKTERSIVEGEDYFQGVAAKRQDLENRYRELLRAFDDDLKSAERTTDWRPIDDVLLVPGIEVGKRAKLVGRVRAFPHIGGDQQGDGVARTADGETQPSNKDAAALGRAALTRNLGMWLFEQANSALGPNRRSSSTPDFEPAWIYDELPETRTDKSYRPIADGMKRVEDALQMLGPAATASPDGRFQELKTWMAGRLINDFDPDRARKFSDGGGDLEKRRKRLEQENWLSQFDSHCREPLGIDSVPVQIKVQPRQGIPEGVACLLVDVDDAKDRDKVELFRNDLPIDRGTEAPVDPAKPETIVIDVDRGSNDAATPAGRAEIKLRLILFYRGRKVDGRAANLTLNSIESQFIISMESDKEAIKQNRGIKNGDLPADQFTKRPNAVTGYAYPGCFHPCLLTILYQAVDGKSVEVDVEVIHEDGHRSETPKLTLTPGDKKTFAHHTISFVDVKPRDLKAAREENYFRQQKLLVKVWRSGKGRNGNPLARQTLLLSEVNPEKFNTVEIGKTWTKDADSDRPVPVANITVHRSFNDPVVRPVGVAVKSRDGLELLKSFRPHKPKPGQGSLRTDSKGQIALYGDETCIFQFRLPNAEPSARTYQFVVVFAETYEMECKVTVEGTGAPAIPSPARSDAAGIPQ